MRFFRTIVAFAFLLTVLYGSLPVGAKEGGGVLSVPKQPSSSLDSTKRTVAREKTHWFQNESDYVIGPEDVLEISVWKNAALSKTVKVRPDGKISLPLIGGVRAAGLTPDQLKRVIVRGLSHYQKTVIASVMVVEVNSYRIFVLGKVKSPGAYQMKTHTSVLQAIALAGGFTEFASKNKMKLIRSKNDGTGDEKIDIRFKDLVYKRNKNKNIIMQPGDTIFVP